MDANLNQILGRGVERIYPDPESFLRLISKKKIKIYLGIDPRSPNIHIGNAIPLRKLRRLQDLGHKVILVVGDFTATLGDPSDKSETRKLLSRDEVSQNAKTYTDQAAKILDFSSKNSAEVRFNSKWLESLNLSDTIDLASHFTVQQIIERDLFQKRMREEKPIGLHEFLYPLLQGYDSVALDVDAEIGGTDQTFNMLSGRALLKEMKGKEKYALTVSLLPGLDGRKMSKSLGNTVDVTDSPEDMFGKLMSIGDELIETYFNLATDLPDTTIKEVLSEGPLRSKKRLAFEITKMFWGEKSAKEAEKHFTDVIQRKQTPQDMPSVAASGATISDALISSQVLAGTSEVKRVISQGGVSISSDGVNFRRVEDPAESVSDGDIIKKGGRTFIRIGGKND